MSQRAFEQVITKSEEDPAFRWESKTELARIANRTSVTNKELQQRVSRAFNTIR